MQLRKINAGVSLLTTALLLVHAISISFWMLSRGEIPKPSGLMPWILTGCMALHVFISIDMVVTGIMSEKGSKGKKYPRLNASTFLQRASGMLLILFTALHIAGATGAMTPPPAVHAVVPVLFFTIAMLHAAVSTGKAFITLGIGDAKVFKAADVAVKVICGVTLVADVIGFYLHVC